MALERGGTDLKHLSVKQEVVESSGIDKVIRLTSFGLPRDLTLGGSGPRKGQWNTTNKKIYTPNLHAARNRNGHIPTSKNITQQDRKRAEKIKCDRRTRVEKEGLIQTTGLFSDGAGMEYIKKCSRFNRPSSENGSDPVEMRKPSITKIDEKIDVIAENLNIGEILKDKLNDFEESSTALEHAPVKLTEDDKELFMNKSDLHLNQEVKLDPYSFYAKKFFGITQPRLFILQLPDYLPCEDVPNSNYVNINESSGIQGEKLYSLNNTAVQQLQEGLIGRLQKYKSGKCKLILGKIRLNLEFGTDSGFRQDIVSLEITREECSGNILDLGPVEAKFMAIPDWENLFAE